MIKQTETTKAFETCPACQRPPDQSGLEVENDRLMRRLQNLEQELINCSMDDKTREREYQKELAAIEAGRIKVSPCRTNVWPRHWSKTKSWPLACASRSRI
jgi:hypothetical protein